MAVPLCKAVSQRHAARFVELATYVKFVVKPLDGMHGGAHRQFRDRDPTAHVIPRCAIKEGYVVAGCAVLLAELPSNVKRVVVDLDIVDRTRVVTPARYVFPI